MLIQSQEKHIRLGQYVEVYVVKNNDKYEVLGVPKGCESRVSTLGVYDDWNKVKYVINNIRLGEDDIKTDYTTGSDDTCKSHIMAENEELNEICKDDHYIRNLTEI